MQPHKILDAWVKKQQAQSSGRFRFSVLGFAEEIGVTKRSLRLWRLGEFLPIPEHRAALERLTDGAVPASIWER